MEKGSMNTSWQDSIRGSKHFNNTVPTLPARIAGVLRNAVSALLLRNAALFRGSNAS